MAKKLTRDFMCRKRYINVSHSASEVTALLKHNPLEIPILFPMNMIIITSL